MLSLAVRIPHPLNFFPPCISFGLSLYSAICAAQYLAGRGCPAVSHCCRLRSREVAAQLSVSVPYPTHPVTRGTLPVDWRASRVPWRNIWVEALGTAQLWPLMSGQLGFHAKSTYSSNSSLHSCNLMATVQFSSCSLVQTRCDISLMFQMLVQHRCLNPFQGLLLLQYLALYSVLVEQHWDPPLPSLRLRGVSRAGGFFVCPHHLPHVLSIQEPAGGLHWDPSSLISFNSSLKAESPRKQK